MRGNHSRRLISEFVNGIPYPDRNYIYHELNDARGAPRRATFRLVFSQTFR
jgi:hypothetical protein